MTARLVDGGSIDLDRLLLAANAIEPGSFDQIYRHYRPLLVRFADREGARDPEGVADMALFDGFRAFDRMRSPKERSFRSYLYRAARSHIVAETRQSPIATVRLEEASDNAAPELSDPVDALWLDSLLTELTADQRKVVECRFLLDMSSAATAELLDKTPNAVDQLQHRAIRRLRHLAFSGLILAVFVAGIWALLALAGDGGTIDNAPIDDPMTPHQEQEESQTVEISNRQLLDDTTVAVRGQPAVARPATGSTTVPATQAVVQAANTATPSAATPSATKSQAKADRKVEKLVAKQARFAAREHAGNGGKSSRAQENLLKRETRILAKADKNRNKKNK